MILYTQYNLKNIFRLILRCLKSIYKFSNIVLYSLQFFIFIMVNEITETFEFWISNLENIYTYIYILYYNLNRNRIILKMLCIKIKIYRMIFFI